jgi:hypothetical protein
MRSGGRSAVAVLVAALAVLATAAAFVVAHLVLPGDGTAIRFDKETPAGLMVDMWRPEPGGLETGDIAVQMNGRVLSEWLVEAGRTAIGAPMDQAEVLVLRGGQTRTVLQPLGPYDLVSGLGDRWALEFSMIYLLLTSGVVFWLRPALAGARALFLVSSAIVASSTVYFLGLQLSDVRHGLLVGLWLWGCVGLYGVSMAGLLHFYLIFPYRRPALVRRPWLVPAVYVGIWVPYLLRVAAGWQAAGDAAGRLTLLVRATDIITLVAFSLVLATSLVGYRRARTESERRQLRWFVWGLYVAVVPWVALTVVPSLVGSPGILPPVFAGILWCAVPTAIAIAILRERMFDIDIIIRRTLVYSLLSIALALVYFASVVLLQNVFQALTGERRSALVTVLSTLAIAALFGPIRQRLQTVIDRQFYRRKYDAARLLSAFGMRLRDDASADLKHLSDELLAAVHESMQPEHATLWLRAQPGGATKAALVNR